MAHKPIATRALRLSLAYLAVFLVTAGLVIGTLFWRTNDLLAAQVLQTMASEVKGLREQFRAGGIRLLAQTVAERSSASGNGLYLLIDPAGRRVAGNLALRPGANARGQGGPFLYRDAQGRERLAVGVLIEVAGGGELVVARDIEDQRAFVQSMLQIVLIGFAVVVGVGVIGGYFVNRSILGRIDGVSAISRDIMAGDLSRRIPVSGAGDEFDRLSHSLNDMLERIEQLLNSMREVSDNIAHDLKTPLSRLRNAVEDALRDPRGEEAYREALERTLSEADGLIRTFNALLSIARLEAGATGARCEPVALATVVADVVDLFEPAAEEAGLTLDVGTLADVAVTGDRQLLGQAVANLIDNAIKYAAPGDATAKPSSTAPTAPSGRVTSRVTSRVQVSVSRSGSMAHLVVADNGPGIPEADRDRVLKRFVRLEESRTRPGTGLGLSLVAAVTRLHGGTLRLEDNAPGLRAVLALPVAEGAADARASTISAAKPELAATDGHAAGRLKTLTATRS